MRRPERVVVTFGALGEARQAAALSQRAAAVAPAGDDLVWIGLMADVPYQPVVRGIEDIVKADGQFDDAEPGAEMAAGHGHGVDQILAEFLSELRQIGLGQSP